MRLDKFLKVKKALYSVKDSDKLDIRYFNRIFNVVVLKLPPESLKKDDISMYINISEQKEEN